MNRCMLFEAGHIVRTLGALLLMVRHHVSEGRVMERHCSGDFGDVPRSLRAVNTRAIAFGGRIHSQYEIAPNLRVWVITDADRVMTTILLPHEFGLRFPAEQRPIKKPSCDIGLDVPRRSTPASRQAPSLPTASATF